MNHSAPRATAQPPNGRFSKFAVYCDGLTLWTDRGDDRDHFDGFETPVARIRELRRRLKRAGFNPSAAQHSQYGSRLQVSLAPLHGWRQQELEEFLRGILTEPVLQDARLPKRVGKRRRRVLRERRLPLARVTGMAVAIDLIGVPSRVAQRRLLPSIAGPRAGDFSADIFRLKNEKRPSWTHFQNCAYARKATAQKNLAAYFDRPSKLQPDGPAVFHCELRLGSERVPAEVKRDPLNVVSYLTEQGLWLLYENHVWADSSHYLVTRARRALVGTLFSSGRSFRGSHVEAWRSDFHRSEKRDDLHTRNARVTADVEGKV